MTTVYGYARVSTEQQNLDQQLDALRKYGVKEEHIFAEKRSGKNTTERPEWNNLIAVLKPGDTVVAYRLDRIGRSMTDLMRILHTFKEMGVHMVFISQNISTKQDNDDPTSAVMAQAMLAVLGAFAELERIYILERTKGGIEKAKANGVKFGPKKKNPRLYEQAIKQFLDGEGSVKQILKLYDGQLSERTFYRKLQEYKTANGIA